MYKFYFNYIIILFIFIFYRDSAGLIKLELQGNNLKQVNGPFLDSKSLRELHLSNCNLTKLSPQFFVHTRSLSVLDISENPLDILGPNIFYPLFGLKHLIINNCNLTQISNEAFNGLESLTALELTGNNLMSIIDWYSILSSLLKIEHLDLRRSGISKLAENTFFNNGLLKKLVLAENDFSELDLATTLGSNLIHLDFLDLSYCNFKAPLSNDSFANVKQLRSLILSGNYLSAENLEVTLSPLLKLEKLSLKDCALTHLPANALHKLKNLKELDISNNPLINGFSDILSPLDSLENLDMGYSNLKGIASNTFIKMPSLKTLILSGNKLTNFESGSFQNLNRLEVLELNNCGLTQLNGEMLNDKFTFSQLKELRLSGNPLVVPKNGSILPLQLSGLKKLIMNNCNLRFLPNNVFASTPNINYLSLYDNNLKNDSLDFVKSLTKLEQLDLSSNKLASLKPDEFKYNDYISLIKLKDNPWKCDCYVVDMWEWIMLFKKNVDLLDGLLKSVHSHSNDGKNNKLVCHIDPKSTPIRKAKLSQEMKLNSNLHHTWARYMRESDCRNME